MDKEAQQRLEQKARRLRLSEIFRDYRVELVPVPDYPHCDTIYDVPMRTIWINTAADPGANVSIFKPGR